MAVLVALLAFVVALLGVLVAGLLRSHAEILRALHELGVDLDPASEPGGVATPVAAPTVRRTAVASRAPRAAVDVVGTTPQQDAVSIAVAGTRHLTLLAFLSSGCGSCLAFWEVFGRAGPLEIPGDARLVCVTKSADAESVAGIVRLAPTTVPVVMSSAAWDAYDVPVAPFFVLVDGPSGSVVGEGAANEWEQVESLLRTALDDAGMLDRRGLRKEGAQPRVGADARREARADRDLLTAGIVPGHPSLYRLPDASPAGLTRARPRRAPRRG
jgi:hypothetical protein